MEFESIVFWAALAVAFVIFFFSISCDVEKRGWGWVKVAAFFLFCLALTVIMLSHGKESSGTVTKKKGLPRNSEWELVKKEQVEGMTIGFFKSLKNGATLVAVNLEPEDANLQIGQKVKVKKPRFLRWKATQLALIK